MFALFSFECGCPPCRVIRLIITSFLPLSLSSILSLLLLGLGEYISDAHSVELAGTGSGDLLGAERDQLGLELSELSLELLLVLSPKLGGLDLCGL